MKLDRTFAREISKAANECESRAFMRKIRETKKSLSTPDVCHAFGECISKCGRVPVAICVAATIIKRRDRLRAQTVRWAEAVLKLWTKNPDSAYIDDNLHPTRIEEYAGAFMRLTTEEA